jgi:PleD family two-component response regulator
VVGRLGASKVVVLSHASDEASVREFASRISTGVRELGLHHPRSSVSKFVTVSFEVGVSANAGAEVSARDFLQGLLDS